MHWSFFLLPIGIYCGVAAQGLGLMVLGIMIPIAVFRSHPKFPAQSVGWLFISSYLVFATSNILNYYWLGPVKFVAESISFGNVDLSLRELLRSRFTFGLGGTGIFLVLSSYLKPSRFKSGQLLTYFLYGLTSISVIIFIYTAIQHFTGFDYRLEGNQLGREKLMVGGNYRAMGLYGHPLSLAGGTLAIIGFSTYLVNAFYEQRSQLHFRLALATLALNIFILIFTGSRGAFVIAALFLFSFLILQKSIPLKPKLIVLGIAGVAIGTALTVTGLAERLGESFFGDRKMFWQVYEKIFFDRPWVGQGQALLEEAIKDIYYRKLGLGSFAKKYNAHNLYLETLACAGILGMFALFLFFAKATIRVRQYLEKHSKSTYLFAAFAAAAVLNLVHGLIQNTFYDANVSYVYLSLFWFIFWQSREEN